MVSNASDVRPRHMVPAGELAANLGVERQNLFCMEVRAAAARVARVPLDLSEADRLLQCILQSYSSHSGGPGFLNGVLKVISLAALLPDLPESIVIRQLHSLIEARAYDASGRRDMRVVLMQALDVAAPGLVTMLDYGWTLYLQRPPVSISGEEPYNLGWGIWGVRPNAKPFSEPTAPAARVRHGIYMASKATAHGPTWQAMRAKGWPIISTWIDESAPGLTLDWPDLWARCLAEVASAAVCIVYMEAGEQLKGAWAEVGAALEAGVPVIGVGIEEFSIAKSGKITVVETIEQAFDLARAFLEPVALAGR